MKKVKTPTLAEQLKQLRFDMTANQRITDAYIIREAEKLETAQHDVRTLFSLLKQTAPYSTVNQLHKDVHETFDMLGIMVGPGYFLMPNHLIDQKKPRFAGLRKFWMQTKAWWAR